ncbi:hypothetical protein QUC31_009294 [Theobroma cacao]
MELGVYFGDRMWLFSCIFLLCQCSVFIVLIESMNRMENGGACDVSMKMGLRGRLGDC